VSPRPAFHETGPAAPPASTEPEALIDFILEQSFPASDPPAWSSVRDVIDQVGDEKK